MIKFSDRRKEIGGLYPVFAYGSLKRGFFYHDAIADGEYIGKAKTKYPCWIMHALASDEYKNYFYPAVSYGGKYYIEGELYLVDQQTLTQLDIVEENGFAYERKETDITHPDFKKAWMYVSILEGRITHPIATKHFVCRNRQSKSLSWQGGFL